MNTTLEPLNYTPHDIVIQLGKERSLCYQTVGVCRAKAREAAAFIWDEENDIEVHAHGWAIPENPLLVVMRRPSYDDVEWVPGPPAEGADVIVSVVAADPVVKLRPDLRVFVPDTGPASAIRHRSGKAAGQIKAIRRLILWHDPYAATYLLRVITLVNPVDEGNGSYLHSRHLPTREGIEEAVQENPSGGYLELANEHGQSRLYAHIPLLSIAHDAETFEERLQWSWKWLQIQIAIDRRSEAGEPHGDLIKRLRELEAQPGRPE
jgi:hypothetical protein